MRYLDKIDSVFVTPEHGAPVIAAYICPTSSPFTDAESELGSPVLRQSVRQVFVLRLSATGPTRKSKLVRQFPIALCARRLFHRSCWYNDERNDVSFLKPSRSQPKTHRIDTRDSSCHHSRHHSHTWQGGECLMAISERGNASPLKEADEWMKRGSFVLT